MILQIVDNKINQDMKEEYLLAAKAFVAESRENDPGCLSADVFIKNKQDDHVFIITKWDRQDSLKIANSKGTFLKHKQYLKPGFISNQTTIFEQA